MRITRLKSRSSALSQRPPDYTLVGVTLVLLVFGLVMLSSASLVQSLENKHPPYYYVIHQLVYGVGIGLPLCWVLSILDYHLWKRYALPIMILSVVSVLLVLVPGIGTELNMGARRWLNIGGIIVQPSEFIKLAFLIYLAAWLDPRQKHLTDMKTSLLPFLMMLGFLVIVIAGAQSDLGTTVIVSVIAITAYFIAGAPWKHLLVIASLCIVMFGGMVGIALLGVDKFKYRVDRITIFLNPQSDTVDAGFHINQSLLAIGSGGLLGVGLGQSRQKWNYLPEAASDSIFAIIAEEMGFIISVGLILLYGLFMMHGFAIARDASDMFGKILASGVTTWVAFQAAINIMAMLSLLPLTGIPLPFISYGSTSLITLLGATGILINISRR